MSVPFLVVRATRSNRMQADPSSVVSRHSTRKKAAARAKRHVWRGLMPDAFVIDARPQPRARGYSTRLRPRPEVVRAYHA